MAALPKNYIDVWIVEDSVEYRTSLVDVIDSAEDMLCPLSFGTCEDAIAALQKESPPQFILMDIGLPGMSGIEGVPPVKSISPSTEVIMLTVYEDDDKIFRSICAGASGYLLKKQSAAQILDCIREACRGGAAMNAHIARKVLDMFAKVIAPQGDYALTRREKEILEQAAAGLCPKMIASELCISLHTVTTHMKNIFAKLQVHSRSEAVAKALRENLI